MQQSAGIYNLKYIHSKTDKLTDIQDNIFQGTTLKLRVIMKHTRSNKIYCTFNFRPTKNVLRNENVAFFCGEMESCNHSFVTTWIKLKILLKLNTLSTHLPCEI